MTYCVGMKLDRGLVFMSDTRTNAGVDNISVFKKMFQWEVPGERSITLMTAGNLATTQAVVSLLNERSIAAEDRGTLSIVEAPSMFQVAKLVGETLREVIADQTGQSGQTAERAFGASMILGGQVRGGETRMFHIYPEGNFVEASTDTPFFQIGEAKYGKPIIVRAYDPALRFEEAVKLLMVSFDSTLKANLSVGMPLDLHLYEADTLRHGLRRRIEPDDPFFAKVSSGWGEKLREAFDNLPDYSLD
ncbi:proteasome-type protease [Rhodobacteraceae bacterium N5(2021)]|uniref:Proteasome-type protease n=1 Tax=Gymnodinialimonas phycosphaerae TaxID=2841589 RepID=A0A975YH89_9RHOB|nr:proteasome-type protease [Gymnodinialimonas phycosphaerae]MBY4892527.1 proteasome-type protease [Gymnodinialimonas phycosphaerae]